MSKKRKTSSVGPARIRRGERNSSITSRGHMESKPNVGRSPGLIRPGFFSRGGQRPSSLRREVIWGRNFLTLF